MLDEILPAVLFGSLQDIHTRAINIVYLVDELLSSIDGYSGECVNVPVAKLEAIRELAYQINDCIPG